MSLRVLLIHGDSPDGYLHKTTLLGFEPTIDVSVARTADEIRKLPVPTLILLDLDLVLPPSLEILQWLRSEKSYLPVPVIALSSPQTVERASAARMNWAPTRAG
jgi:DNA-binding response OmpR family regulator